MTRFGAYRYLTFSESVVIDVHLKNEMILMAKDSVVVLVGHLGIHFNIS